MAFFFFFLTRRARSSQYAHTQWRHADTPNKMHELAGGWLVVITKKRLHNVLELENAQTRSDCTRYIFHAVV